MRRTYRGWIPFRVRASMGKVIKLSRYLQKQKRGAFSNSSYLCASFLNINRNLTTFEQLGLNTSVLSAIAEMGFENPTPIQEKSIPVFLETERDILGLAQTGTGKTAAFGLPIL